MSQSILENEVNKIPIQDTDDYFSEQCRFKNLTDAGKRLADKLKLLIDSLSQISSSSRIIAFIVIRLSKTGTTRRTAFNNL